MTSLCRDCGASGAGAACAACGSPRVIRHPELAALGLVHLDCDAFYASIEQRDDPRLRGRPVIVGGGRRGVVLAASYEARRFGVRSAMPMFRALAACPHAAVVRPEMDKYRCVGLAVRQILLSATPLVEPLSIDEAFLDLAGAEPSPAAVAVGIARRIEAELGITVSIGLSWNKFLAKLASDLDKPRGFAVIGRAEAAEFLAPRPVGAIWGVGPAFERRLAADGIATIGDLQRRDARDLAARYGRAGARLARFARGEDDRAVMPQRDTKSISAETTFERDLAGFEELKRVLWALCKRVAGAMAGKRLAGRTVTLKLKRHDFRLVTRSRSLADPTRSAERLYAAAFPLLHAAADGTRYRLIGVGVSALADDRAADPPDLFGGLGPTAASGPPSPSRPP